MPSPTRLRLPDFDNQSTGRMPVPHGLLIQHKPPNRVLVSKARIHAVLVVDGDAEGDLAAAEVVEQIAFAVEDFDGWAVGGAIDAPFAVEGQIERRAGAVGARAEAADGAEAVHVVSIRAAEFENALAPVERVDVAGGEGDHA